MSLQTRPAPPVRAYTPGPPNGSDNFLKEQIAKQQKGNFHSTSLKTTVKMVAQSVNKTALHPGGESGQPFVVVDLVTDELPRC